MPFLGQPTQSRTLFKQSISITFYSILFICLLLGSCEAIARRKLHRAKVDRVPDSYFVHFWRDTNHSIIQGVLDELEELNRDETNPNFTVTLKKLLREAANGLAVKMSNQALQHVSSTNMHNILYYYRPYSNVCDFWVSSEVLLMLVLNAYNNLISVLWNAPGNGIMIGDVMSGNTQL